jgi:outer membrane protein W
MIELPLQQVPAMRSTSLLILIVVGVGISNLSAVWAADGSSATSNASFGWEWQLRAVYLDPTSRDSLPMDGGAFGELSGALRVGPRWSAEIALGIPTSFHVRDPAYAESFKLMINTLTVKYDLVSTGVWRPYVGAGLAYVPLTHKTADTQASVGRFDGSTTSWVLQGGLTLGLTDNVFVSADTRYLGGLEPHFSVEGSGFSGKVGIDPLLFAIGIGARF